MTSRCNWNANDNYNSGTNTNWNTFWLLLAVVWHWTYHFRYSRFLLRSLFSENIIQIGIWYLAEKTRLENQQKKIIGQFNNLNMQCCYKHFSLRTLASSICKVNIQCFIFQRSSNIFTKMNFSWAEIIMYVLWCMNHSFLIFHLCRTLNRKSINLWRKIIIPFYSHHNLKNYLFDQWKFLHLCTSWNEADKNVMLEFSALPPYFCFIIFILLWGSISPVFHVVLIRLSSFSVSVVKVPRPRHERLHSKYLIKMWMCFILLYNPN